MKYLSIPIHIFRKFIKLKLILRGSFCFLFFMSLGALSKNKIFNLSKQAFSLNTPGFYTTLRARSIGKWFELEMALILKDFYDEEILGFGLDLNISDTLNNYKVEVLVPGFKVELRTTEYDIVTNNYVFECKSGKYFSIKQFIKERNIIKWFNVLKMEASCNLLKYRVAFNSRKRPIFIINGLSTLGKDVCLSSSWFEGCNLNKFYDFWFGIIELISSKKLRLAFKRELSEKQKNILFNNNFIFEDNFSYDNFPLL